MSSERITTAADAVHFLAIDTDWDGPRLRFICTATKGAECHKQHPDPDVESFTYDDPALIDTDTCWAAEWAEEGGLEALEVKEGAEFARIPVDVSFTGDGPLIEPVTPHPLLPIPDQQPTAQPTVEDVARAAHRAWFHGLRGVGGALISDELELSDRWYDAARAVLALLPGRPESVVKTEALAEARDEIAALRRLGLCRGCGASNV